jgi:hypothetical protein
MALTWLDVTAMAPELSDVPVSAQDEILADVDDLPDDVWGARLTQGKLALARHLGTMQKRRGQPGQLGAKHVGDISATYVHGQNPSAYSSTSYGVEFERLLMALPGARVTVA